MRIEEYLKSIHFTKLDLSKSLKISRPTLYTYIEKYNNDLPLGNNKYQTIFDELFEKEFPREVFLSRLQKAQKHLLENEIFSPFKKGTWLVIRTNDDASREKMSNLLKEGYIILNSISASSEVEYVLFKEEEL